MKLVIHNLQLSVRAIQRKSSEYILAFVSEVLRARSQISIVDGAKTFLPYRSQFSEFTFGDRIDVSFCNSVQFIVYRQCITIHDTRHCFLRNQSVILHTIDDVIETSAGRERTVAMIANVVNSAVNHRVVYNEHFRKIVFTLSCAEQFRFEKTEA